MKTPVLVLAHQRPKQLKHCLERLNGAGCVQLFVSVDGPGEAELHNKVVKLALEYTSTDRIQFLPKNLGCEKGVLAGINWFFNQVAEGIIVEEDVLISDDGLAFWRT